MMINKHRTIYGGTKYLLLILTILLGVVFAGDATGEDTEIRCITEWGLKVGNEDNESTKNMMKVLPSSYINDGYCDCIYSGLDETNTSACSGMVTMTVRKDTPPPPPTLFTCPIEQQPMIQLPMSRINDGICDCCNGADEVVTTLADDGTTITTSNHCTDNCAAIIEQQRQLRKQLQTQYSAGSKERMNLLQQYQDLISKTKKEIKQIRHTIKERTATLTSYYKRNLFTVQFQYIHYHLSRVLNSIYDKITGTSSSNTNTTPFSFVQVLSKDEIERIMISICQLYGEMIHKDNEQQASTIKTCIPIRLAAIELGDIFVNHDRKAIDDTPDATNIEFRRISQQGTKTDEMAMMLATIFDYNSNIENIQEHMWSVEDYNKYIEYLDRSMSPSSKKAVKRSTQQNREDYEDEEYEEDYYDDDDYNHHDNDMGAGSAPFKLSYHVDDFLYMNYQQREEMKVTMLNDPLNAWMYRHRQVYIQHIPETILPNLDRQIKEHEEKAQKEDAAKQKNTDEEEIPELVLADEEMLTDPTSDSDKEIRELLLQAQSTFQSHVQGIHYGHTMAMSAQYLLQSITKESMTYIDEARFSEGGPVTNDIDNTHYQYVQKLLLGTIYYSQLPYYSVYEIFLNILSNTTSSLSSSETAHIDEQTCVVPYSHLCPPKSMFVDSESRKIPVPKEIYNEMITFCNERFMGNEAIDYGIASCAATTAVSNAKEIPTKVSDGDYGYYPIVKRNDENDVLYTLFVQTYGSDVSLYGTEDEMKSKKEMNDQQDVITDYTKNIYEMEGKLRDLQEIMDESISSTESTASSDEEIDGMIELPKYGLDGELYSIKDQCFDYVQGKYKYEICLYQGASQKDIEHDTSGSGTSLGTWSGTYMETIVDGNNKSHKHKERIWKWTNGVQCWNGPQRSITAHVNKCGPITKIISANEPDTCRYVLVVESPVVCDTIYQKRYGLE